MSDSINNDNNIVPQYVGNEILSLINNSKNDELASYIMDGLLGYYIKQQASKLHHIGIEQANDDARLSVLRAITAMMFSDCIDKESFIESLKNIWLDATFISSQVKAADASNKEL